MNDSNKFIIYESNIIPNNKQRLIFDYSDIKTKSNSKKYENIFSKYLSSNSKQQKNLQTICSSPEINTTFPDQQTINPGLTLQKLTELNNENNKLKNEKSKLENDLIDLMNINKSMKIMNEKLIQENTIQKKEQQVSKIDINKINKLDELLTENTYINEKFNIQNELIHKLKIELLQKDSEISELKNMLGNEKNSVSTLKEEIYINSYNKAKSQCEQKISEISENLVKTERECNDLKNKNNICEKDINEKNILIGDLEIKFNNIKNKFDLLDNEYKNYTDKKSDEINKLNLKINELNDQITEKDLLIEKLSEENKNLTQKNDGLNIDYNKINKECITNKNNIKINKELIEKQEKLIKEKELNYDLLQNEFSFKEKNYLNENRKLKQELAELEEKYKKLIIDLNNKENESIELNKEKQYLINEINYYKTQTNQMSNLENEIKNYKNKEIDLIREKNDIMNKLNIQNNDTKSFQNKLNELNQEILEEKNSKQKLIDEREEFVLNKEKRDREKRDIISEIKNIDSQIEYFKTKMKNISNYNYLSKGFQVFLTQRINKEMNLFENIYLYLSSSSMEIESLVNELKVQEEFNNRYQKNIVNLHTDIENLQKNGNNNTNKLENKEEAFKNIINDLNNIIIEKNKICEKYKSEIQKDEFIISESCIKIENYEKIIENYDINFKIMEEIFLQLSHCCKNVHFYEVAKEFLIECNRIINLGKSVISMNGINCKNCQISDEELKQVQNNVIFLFNSLKQQITVEKMMNNY